MNELALKYGCNPNQKPSRIYMEDGKLVQTIDSRFPTCTNSEKLTAQITAALGEGAKLEDVDAAEPFYIEADSHAIRACIDTYNEAINQHKKMRFRKIEYNVKKERALHHGGEKYTFSPYSLVWDGDNYYVVGYSDKYENIGSHRVDRIAEQPEILDEPVVPPKAGLSVEKYVKTTFRMYNAPRKEVELLCDNGVMDAIIDQFGPDVHTYAGALQNFRVIEEVAVGKVFFNWIFGFEGMVRIKAPADVKEQNRQMVENAAKVL